MEPSEKLTPALKKAQEAGVDLTLLYERLSWTPTERIWRNYETAEAFEELRKAGKGIVLATNIEKLLKALYGQKLEFVIIGGAVAVLHGPVSSLPT
jgi:hypothetical protein